MPDPLKKGAVLLNDLFKLIDENYELDDDNIDDLEEISDLLANEKPGSDKMKQALDTLLENMKGNFETWPNFTKS